MIDSYTISTERKYRKVFQGTEYTLKYTDDSGEVKTVVSGNRKSIFKFISQGFKREDWDGTKISAFDLREVI